MEVEFLDTNSIIRYLTQDNPDQAERAYRLFQDVDSGRRIITTSEAVIAEAVYVLSSKDLYHLSRVEVSRHLTTVVSLRGLKLPNKRVFLRALDLYVSTPLDFVDALNVAHMERAKLKTILSFDRHFDRIPGIVRRDP